MRSPPGGIALLVLASLSRAQTAFVEIEPNSGKATATAAECLVTGDFLRGASLGAGTSPLDGGPATVDTWRVSTCPAPLAIYRHRMVLSTIDEVPHGYAASLRALFQSDGVVVPGSDALLQQAWIDNPYERSVEWYGFGRGESVYFRVQGNVTTEQDYRSTLATTVVAPEVLPFTIAAGVVTITTESQGHASDTELWLYDANLVAIPGWGNDDTPAAPGTQSTLTRVIDPGTYYLALGTYDLANERTAALDDGFRGGFVLDFADAIAEGPSAVVVPQLVDFEILDAVAAHRVAAVRDERFEVLWYRLDVVPTVPSIATFCSGDGSGTACPCGNPGTPDHGCASSLFPSGASLEGLGVPSVVLDTFQLRLTQAPDSFALYFQGDAVVNGGAGATFGDGLRCVGGNVLRQGTKPIVGGVSVYPEVGDVPISIQGVVSPFGGFRVYQGWYRNSAAFCTGAVYNLSNGIAVTWIP